jgi:hypothetical protein
MPRLREDTIRAYFDGELSPTELDREAAASLDEERSAGAKIVRHHVADMASDYTIGCDHLLQFLDDIIQGRIGLQAVDAIAFCIEASDRFTWSDAPPDCDRIPEVMFWLGTPEVNAPLAGPFLERVREFLRTGESPFM